VGPEGALLTYRKRHLVYTTPEPQVFSPGDELPVVGAGGVRVALAICWDLGFPEVARESAMLGAELVLAPCGWRDPWGPQYEISLSARALDSGVYVASANQLGSYPEARFSAPGHVYGPDGLRASRAERHGIRCVAELDPEFPARWRRLYGATLDEPRALPLLGGSAV
jgi:5-aminopentanamidase